MNKIQDTIQEKVTQQIILRLEHHQNDGYTLPWINVRDGKMPHNIFSQHKYTGGNVIYLSIVADIDCFQYNGWVTLNQVNKLGGRIKKGSKSEVVYFVDFFYWNAEKKWKFSHKEYAKLTAEAKKKCNKIPFLKTYPVFNLSQTEGLGEEFYYLPKPEDLTPPEMDAKAEQLINSTGAEIIYKYDDKACYQPTKDRIILPYKEQFISTDAYYETVLHELGHWTGHKSRMNRENTVEDKKMDYAYEELVAELFSAFCCARFGLSKTITNNVAYIGSWLKALHDDKKFIMKASSEAQKAVDFVFKDFESNSSKAA